jgi:hypothetical protein
MESLQRTSTYPQYAATKTTKTTVYNPTANPQNPPIRPLFLQMIKERIFLHNKNAMAICVGETGCIFEDTKIWIDGQKKQIKEAPDFFVTKVYDGKKIINSPAILNKTGIKNGFEITFKSGNKVIVSEDHKWLKNNEWIKTKDLVVGDKIAKAENFSRTNRLYKKELSEYSYDNNFGTTKNEFEYDKSNSKKVWDTKKQGIIKKESFRKEKEQSFMESKNKRFNTKKEIINARKSKSSISDRKNNSGLSEWICEQEDTSRKVSDNNKKYLFDSERNWKNKNKKGSFNRRNESILSQKSSCRSSSKDLEYEKEEWERQSNRVSEAESERDLYFKEQNKQSIKKKGCKNKEINNDERLLQKISRKSSELKTNKESYDKNRENSNEQTNRSWLSNEQGLSLQQIHKDKYYILIPRFFDNKTKINNRMRWRLFSQEYDKRTGERSRIKITWLSSPSFQRERNSGWQLCEETIINITKLESFNTYDLTIPKYENYVLADGYIVHNSGKTYASLRMAEILDKDFNIDRVVFDTEEFLTVLKDGLANGTLKKGSVIIYDEMGIGHSNRNFQDALNKALNFVFQGFRRENLIVFFTVPKLKFVDVQLRELVHFIITPKSIDRTNNILKCKGYCVRQNAFNLSDKQSSYYYENPTAIGAGIDGVSEINNFGLMLPSKMLRIAYEEKKKKYMMELYDQARELSKIVKHGVVNRLRGKLQGNELQGEE